MVLMGIREECNGQIARRRMSRACPSCSASINRGTVDVAAWAVAMNKGFSHVNTSTVIAVQRANWASLVKNRSQPDSTAAARWIESGVLKP